MQMHRRAGRCNLTHGAAKTISGTIGSRFATSAVSVLPVTFRPEAVAEFRDARDYYNKQKDDLGFCTADGMTSAHAGIRPEEQLDGQPHFKLPPPDQSCRPRRPSWQFPRKDFERRGVAPSGTERQGVANDETATTCGSAGTLDTRAAGNIEIPSRRSTHRVASKGSRSHRTTRQKRRPDETATPPSPLERLVPPGLDRSVAMPP